MSTILTISDLHAGFIHKDAVDFLKDLKKTYKPDHIVLLGDVVDQYCFSSFDHDPDAMGASEEEELAFEQLEPLYALFPKAKCCLGNHDKRIYKKAMKAGIPSRMLPKFRDLIRAPKGWEFAENFTIGNTFFFHGDGLTGRTALMTAIQQYRTNVVFGHVHSCAGAAHINNGRSQVWAMGTGCLVDPEAYAFQYAAASRDKPVIGTGIILDNTPLFIPLT
jgi:predicted phosphodiesterase